MTTQEEIIKVGITHGDINGIGYEVIIKAFAYSHLSEICNPIVFGSSKIASYHKKSINISDVNFNFNLIRNIEQARHKHVNILNITENEVKIEMGKSTELGGSLALMALEKAVEELKKGHIDVLVTAPINKHNIQSKSFNFPGHTEYLASKFDCKDYLMLMVSDQLRVGTITGHIALNEVPLTITKELIINKISILNSSLIKDFAIRKPRIALLGLNPHSGDNGLIGNEEQNIIIPAINHAFEKMGILAYGPYPADGFFASSEFRKFDAVLSMYHDQGLIPFKTISHDSGVNFTAGLPIIRTSPAHGTAYDIAGMDVATGNSFKEAVFLAMEVFNNRKEYNELNANTLKFSKLDEDN
ncbi:MAG: 4-hydroxythreonine-4-phosphate dehydrogenase PdxA [Bacteroidales bacterium]|nr:4-hydroxythreonine-4-phosphate dehydrogenase PdxA [Bacteroidales bacterium]